MPLITELPIDKKLRFADKLKGLNSQLSHLIMEYIDAVSEYEISGGDTKFTVLGALDDLKQAGAVFRLQENNHRRAVVRRKREVGYTYTVRFIGNKDRYDKSITAAQYRRLIAFVRHYGRDLDLYKCNDVFYGELWVLPNLPKDDERVVNFELKIY
jgi:hypothetical protein